MTAKALTSPVTVDRFAASQRSPGLLTPALRKSLSSTYLKFTRRLSMMDTRVSSSDGRESKEEQGQLISKQKRKSLFLSHTPFPGFTRGEDNQSSRKSAEQVREEMALLRTLGVKTDAAMPTELHIFRNRPKTRLVMSSFDLWGPNHAKLAFRSMGYSEAFTTMECRDRRNGLVLEGMLSSKFNPRMADDVSSMKALNTPMVRTGKINSARTSARKVTLRPSGKSSTLQAILQNCEELQAENRALRRRVERTPNLRKVLRRVDRLQKPSV